MANAVQAGTEKAGCEVSVFGTEFDSPEAFDAIAACEALGAALA